MLHAVYIGFVLQNSFETRSVVVGIRLLISRSYTYDPFLAPSNRGIIATVAT